MNLPDVIALQGQEDGREVFWVDGIVTAVQRNGAVNITVAGQRIPGVMSLESYTNRHVGDNVAVLKSGRRYLVIGKYSATATIDDELTPGSLVVQPSESGSFIDNSPYLPTDGVVRQGQDPDASGGTLSGGWFYGTALSTALHASTPLVARIWLERNDDGAIDDVTVMLGLHNFATEPASLPFVVQPTLSVSLGINEGSWYVLPDGWLAMLVAGTAKGLGVSSSEPSEFLALSGESGKIEVIY